MASIRKKILKKKNGEETTKWVVDVTISGRRQRLEFSTKAQAEDYSRELHLRPLDRVLDFKPDQEIAVCAAVEKYLSTRSKQKAIGSQCVDQNILGKLSDRFGKSDLSVITSEDLIIFQQQLIKSVVASTVNRQFGVIKNFFRLMKEWGYLKRNPALSVPKLPVGTKKERRIYTLAQVEEIRSNVTDWFTNAMLILAHTGMRRNELVHLRWGSVDFVNRQIFVESHNGFHTKNYDTRPIYMTTLLYKNLQGLKFLAKKLGKDEPNDFVMINEIGNPITPDRVTKRFEHLAQKLKLQGFTAHALRHSYASQLANKDVNQEKIQKLLGHKDIRTTRQYTHVDQSGLRDAVAKLESVSDGHQKHSSNV